MPRKKSEKKTTTPVHIPKAVKDAEKKADEAVAKAQGNPEPDPDVIVDKIDDSPEPETVPPVEEPVAEAPVDVPPVKADTPSGWEQKYNVLQGKYNAEVGELRSVVGNLQNLVTNQNALLDRMQAAPPAAAQPAPAPAAQAVDLAMPKPLNPEDFSGYGDDIKYLAQSHNQLLEINKKQGEIIAGLSNGGGGVAPDSQRLERVESFMQETASDRYNRNLDTMVPKWREIVFTDAFNNWLGQVDDVSNYVLKDMFDFAQKNFRFKQAASIIGRYAIEHQIDVGIQGQTSQPGKPAIVDHTRIDPLANQVVPDASTGSDGGQAPPTRQEAYPTRQDVAKASDLYAQGKIKAKEFNEISDRFMMGEKARQQQQ